MGLSCGMKLLKFILFAFNFVFWIAGIGVLAVGIWSRVQAKDYDSFLGKGGVFTAANIMIAAGCFVMIVGFVGCCGAWKENRCLLIIYFVALLLIFILEIAAGIFAYVKKDEVYKEIRKNLKKAVEKSYSESTSASEADKAFTKAVNTIQVQLKCCGVDKPDDWKNSNWHKNAGLAIAVPKSCCKDQKAKAGAAGCNSKIKYRATAHNKGCVQALEDFVKNHIAVVGGMGVGIAFIQLLGMIFSMCLYLAIGRSAETV